MGKIQKATRLPKDVADRVERYAEQREITEADALRRLVRVGLDEEEEIVADGGYLRPNEHPWVEPLIDIGDRAGLLGLTSALLSAFVFAVPTGAIGWFGVELTAATVALFASLSLILFLFGACLSTASALCLLALEYFMHPAEAPIRRYFYTHDDADDGGEVVA